MSSKADTSLAPVAIVQSHRKKYQNHTCVATSPFAEMLLDEMLEKKGIKKKLMDFNYCVEHLISIPNKVLLWQS